MKPIIIGIAGGTGSGKSTFTNRLHDAFGEQVAVLYHDNYYRCNDDISFEERKKLNYDHPDAFETELLVKHLARLKENQAIECPTYDYSLHNRARGTVRIEPKPVILLEGILVLFDERIRDLLDIKIFVDADPDERLIRVIQRDVIERGRTAEAVMERYTRVLKPMHLQFIEPCKRYADLIVPEGGSNQVAIDILTMYIKKHLGN